MWREAVRRLRFKEVTHTGLGYGAAGVQGSGVGPVLAGQLVETAKELIDAGLTDPSVFELVGLYQDKFGPDRLSDTVVRIALPELLKYNQRVVARLKLPTKQVVVEGKTIGLPYDEDRDRWFLLLPKSILTALPVAYSYSEIDRVCEHNAGLREYVNDRLGEDWKEILADMSKPEIVDFLTHNSGVLKEIVVSYKNADVESYDFASDPSCEIRWHQEGRRAASENPLPLSLPKDRAVIREDVVAVVDKICKKFKHLVEHGSASDVLRDENDKPRIERISQRLFYCIADSYCEASNLDLSPEPNAGNGPVDFKVSSGYDGRVLVELKRSNNPQLEHGYDNQLERYKAAEQTTDAFFVVIDYGNKDETIEAIIKKSKKAKRAGKRYSYVVRVDAQPQTSASKWYGSIY